MTRAPASDARHERRGRESAMQGAGAQVAAAGAVVAAPGSPVPHRQGGKERASGSMDLGARISELNCKQLLASILAPINSWRERHLCLREWESRDSGASLIALLPDWPERTRRRGPAGLLVLVYCLAGIRACPRVRGIRGWRVRAWFSARDGWRARTRAWDLTRGRGYTKLVSARILPAAILSRTGGVAVLQKTPWHLWKSPCSPAPPSPLPRPPFSFSPSLSLPIQIRRRGQGAAASGARPRRSSLARPGSGPGGALARGSDGPSGRACGGGEPSGGCTRAAAAAPAELACADAAGRARRGSKCRVRGLEKAKACSVRSRFVLVDRDGYQWRPCRDRPRRAWRSGQVRWSSGWMRGTGRGAQASVASLGVSGCRVLRWVSGGRLMWSSTHGDELPRHLEKKDGFTACRWSSWRHLTNDALLCSNHSRRKHAKLGVFLVFLSSPLWRTYVLLKWCVMWHLNWSCGEAVAE